MSTQLSEERKQELNEKVTNAYARLIGFASFLIGLIALIFASWAGYLGLHADFSSVAVVFLGVVFLVSAFFLNVGWRMLMNRPNRYGSILSPLSWVIVGFLFTAAAVLVSSILAKISSGSPDFVNTVISLISCFVFAGSCFYLAYLASQKKS
ncbi:MAG: hypothetical protein OQJ89_02695 [Kangiellaceae bacterium]|nr:hypothetical protein [Kangiellaceae bacterium]MCW9015855.1 hypothetical protein [Kangiellaceae bacterium]